MTFFTASKLFWLVFEPSHFLVIMTITTVILLNTKFYRIGRCLAVASAILFVVIGILPTNIWLLRPLEDWFPRPPWPSHIDGVLVLSGGLNTEILKSRDAPATECSEARLVSAYELARHYPNARIVFSGGSGEIGGSKYPEALAAKYIFGQMGLDLKRLTLEDQSRNTFENIYFSQKLVKPHISDTWVLATSAFQMPRAMQVAEHLHWKMIPWPTDYSTTRSRWAGFFNVAGNLSAFDDAVHEWLGLVAYRWNNMSLPVPTKTH